MKHLHGFTRASLGALALCAAAVAASPSRALAATEAGDPDKPLPPPQRHFGFGATAGVYSGIGATVGGGGGFLKGWFTGGFLPVLVVANSRSPDRAVHVNYYNSFQINEDIGLRLFQRPRLEGLLLVGYKFNTVFGHGGGAGVGVIYDLSRRVGLAISGGLSIFPSAKDRLIRDQGYPSDRDPSIPPGLQGGANIGLVFFP